MGGPFGISGFNKGDKKIGTTTFRDLQIMKQYANEKFAAEMSMQNSILMARLNQIKAMQQSGQKGGSGMDGLNKNLESLAKTGGDLYNNINASKSNNSAPANNNTPAPAQNTPAVRTPAAPSSSSAPSGLAQGVDTSDSSATVDTSVLDSISEKLDYPHLTTDDLTSLQSQLSNKKVEVAEKLSAAQADYSNVQGQYETAEENVTRLNGEIDTAETSKKDAQKSLTNNKSQLNQSTKARDQLDDQLSSVNADYKEKCTAVKNCESEKASAQTEVSSAKTSVAQAETGVTMATQELSSAQATLSSTPQTINGQPNPQYQVAQSAVKAAEQKKAQAEASLEKANKSLDEANNRLNTAEENLKTAQDAKSQTLQTLQETDSKYKDMAKRCDQMQKSVETSQENYDTSLETLDTANANYEKLNTELKSQQGILNQLEVYNTKLENLQQVSSRVDEIESTINQQLQAREQTTESMLEHANATEGCSAAKTPAENLISMKDGQQKLDRFAYTAYPFYNKAGMFMVDERQMKAYNCSEVINEDASYFEKSGCLANADGSYTNPENGVTWIDVGGGTWARTDTLYKHQEYMNIAKEKYPETVEALRRAQDQLPDYGIVGLTANSNLRKFMPNWNKMH